MVWRVFSGSHSGVCEGWRPYDLRGLRTRFSCTSMTQGGCKLAQGDKAFVGVKDQNANALIERQTGVASANESGRSANGREVVFGI